MQLRHGSGKTAVLVERIIHKIIDEKMDIDRMLVVTFTNAAASEMRERILDAIYKKIEENPNDVHLQRQITLLNKSNICTIHSFCLDVIRNYFYEIDISANFQIGDMAEMELLKQEALDELFEEKYIKKDKNFEKLIDTYATYRGDEKLKDIILKLYNQIQSTPFPENWLNEKIQMFNLKDKLEEDFSNTIWGGLILKELKEEITENRLKLQRIFNNLKKYPELEKYSLTILNDKEQLEIIESIIENSKENTWQKTYEAIQNLQFEKWPIDKKITIDYKNEAKEQRDKIKKNVNSLISKIMLYSSNEANEAIYEMYDILKDLNELTLEFKTKFASKKMERNRIDFNDIEHFALKILIERNEQNEIIPTSVAKELQEKFDEIAIDEYQDSNLVQEYILNSVSKNNNIFMVGDIKQSIYRFREARPELFIEKYKKYKQISDDEPSSKTDEKNVTGIKIKLFKNFRSREEVLNFTNWVFEEIMSEKLGDVEYTKEEYLNLGANYEKEEQDFLPELHILDLKQEQEEDIWKQEENEDEQQELQDENGEDQIIEKNVEEARLVANRIEELFRQNFMVQDRKKGKRKLEYKDIVILLRSTTGIAPIYEKELLNKGFPVFCDTSSEYLEASEIQTILALLKIIDNPLQDIPLVQVLRSPIANFTDNELVEIRLYDSDSHFYTTMLKARISVNEELRDKIESFLSSIERWKALEKEMPLNELIWQIYTDTNYYNYVGLLTNGKLRQANLKMLFEKAKQYESASFKGLYNFIHFIDRLRLKNSDMSPAKIVGENDNVIRIMSIHKSKGLEFPVVFVCNFSKKFNKQDLNENIIIHHELGFGPKNIDSNLHIEYPNPSKEAIRLTLEKEMVSEEMRVLYVALTRAKEKLIITATSMDWKKFCKDRQEALSLYSSNTMEKTDKKEKLQHRLIKKYASYLDWLTFILLKEPNQDKITVNVHKLQSYSQKEEQIVEKIDQKVEINKDEIDKISKELGWKYPYIISSKIATKTSVSKLKEQIGQEISEDGEIQLNELLGSKTQYNFEQPKFVLKESEKISSSRRGTLVHLCLQKLDNTRNYEKKDLQELIQKLVEKEIILEQEAQAIPLVALQNYLKSNLWNELREAKEIHKEEPFYLYLPANRINQEYPEQDKILVQGVMDLYYINKNDELILVDYKTDYVQNGEETKLIEKYKKQLDLYKEALEKALNKKVDKVMIYSTWIGEIEIK